MEKIILFYKYVEIENPKKILEWQRTLCGELKLKGRIFIAKEGINATLGGKIESIEEYKKNMDSHALFSNIDFKESPGSAKHFPKLKIKIKKEVVLFGLDPEKVKAQDGGKHLTPQEVNKLIEKNSNLVILDARNNYESAIGTFVNAITPDISYFRELPNYIDNNLEQFKDKEVLMFCTGGIRCERASAYLKSKNITKEVYQIQGGIHRYIEQYPDGYFRGKNYVFDARISVKANNDILSNCIVCKISYDDYTNCINAECNKQIIICQTCIVDYHNTCSKNCLNLVQAKLVNIRKIDCKINIEELVKSNI